MIEVERKSDLPDLIPRLQAGSVHVIGFAEVGLSFFRSYLEFAFGFSLSRSIDLCNKINEADETGTIYPRGKLTGLPVRFFREPITEDDLETLRHCIRDAFIANRDFCKSSEMIFQFSCAVLNQDVLDFEISKFASTVQDDTELKKVTLIFDHI